MNQSAWQQLTLRLADPGQVDAFSDALSELGALSVCLQDAGDAPIYEPAPQTTPLWSVTRVVGLFEPQADLRAALARLEARFGFQPDHDIALLQDQDWVRAGRADFHATRFGRRLWVCPSWEPPPQPGAVNIFLDPGLAFGTGTHPTTALCLEWLDAHPDLTGKHCLDYGCGSGILALAALKLGAARVLAVDNDPQALQATAENAEKNGVGHALSRYLPQHLPEQKTDILLANILAKPLLELEAYFASLLAPGGEIVLSGILADQARELAEAYQTHFQLDPIVEQAGWVRLSGRLSSGL